MYAGLYEQAIPADTPAEVAAFWDGHHALTERPGYRGLIIVYPDDQLRALNCLLFDTAEQLAAAATPLAGQLLATGIVRFADVQQIAAGKVAGYADLNRSSFDPHNLPDLAMRQGWAALWHRFAGHCGWLNVELSTTNQLNIAFFASAADFARLDAYRETDPAIQHFLATEIGPRATGPLDQLGRGPVRFCDVRRI